MTRELLLVDDDGVVLPALKRLFENQGFQVSTARSAREASAALRQAQFDIVITDMRMETPTAGFDVVKVAKAQSRPPVAVILSAYPIPIEDWGRSGADALFMKVAASDGMFDKLEQLLRNRSSRPKRLPRCPQRSRRKR